MVQVFLDSQQEASTGLLMSVACLIPMLSSRSYRSHSPRLGCWRDARWSAVFLLLTRRDDPFLGHKERAEPEGDQRTFLDNLLGGAQL